jgi:predicted nucleic acid-binding protein
VSAFLLDTNVISELVKPKPEPKVTAWIDATDEDRLFLSVLTLGEIRKGVVLLPRSARRTALDVWLSEELLFRFSDRILGVDLEVADRWGHLAGLTGAKGVQLSVIDGLLAATAIQHNLTLVTRDTSDVAATGVSLFNPWTDASSVANRIAQR